MDGCVAKPIDAAALIDSIRGALEGQQIAAPADESEKATSAAH